MIRLAYDTDLTNDQREILNSLMPPDFLNWPCVYTYFRAWEADGTWKKLNDRLREMVRLQAGRNVQAK